MTVRCATALSTHPDPAVAAGETLGTLVERMDGDHADAVIVFASAHHRDALDDIAGAVRTLLSPTAMIGTAAQGVVADIREVEHGAGLALWALSGAPGTVALEATPDTDLASAVTATPSGVVLVTDPFTTATEDLLAAITDQLPGTPIVGGQTGAGTAPGENRLIVNDEVRRGGAALLLLGPDVRLEPVVSQGCRPVGSPWVVTASEGPLIQELGGQPPVDRLRSLAEDSETVRMLSSGIHLGVVVAERPDSYQRGDFLVRSVLGAQQGTGAITIGEHVPLGSVVQFHVRDSETAHEDLVESLTGRDAAGALLFTCNGRGTHMFREPHHDASTASEALDVPLAGMFCAGEIGPVAGRPFLHGFTASFALVR